MRFVPVGYSITRAGRTVGLIFGSWCMILAVVGWIGSGTFILGAPFLLMAAVFYILGPLSDYTLNRKASTKRAYMTDMLGQISCCGEILEIERLHKLFGKYLPVAEGVRYNHEYMRFRVGFTDPYTGEKREVLSEIYYSVQLIEKVRGKLKVEPCFDPDNALVFAAEDGRVWVDPIYVSPNQ